MKRWTPLECAEAAAAVCGVGIVIWLIVWMIPQAIEVNQAKDSRRASRAASGECIHTGYAGRDYEKVFNCRGLVLRRSEL